MQIAIQEEWCLLCSSKRLTNVREKDGDKSCLKLAVGKPRKEEQIYIFDSRDSRVRVAGGFQICQ